MRSSAAWAGLLAAGLSTAPSHALELQPTTLQLAADQIQTELWLVNDATTPWTGRIRLYQWDQASGRDRLQSTTTLVASPAALRLPPGARQRVRLVRVTGTHDAAGPEQAFRAVVFTDDREQTRYSLPLFISPRQTRPLPVLARLGSRGPGPCVQLHNPGSHRARLQDLTFIDHLGHPHSLQAGLAGYVLAGATVCWPLPAQAAGYAGGHFQARRDGTASETLGWIAAGSQVGL